VRGGGYWVGGDFFCVNLKFGATDVESKMYAIEQFHDWRMVENRSVLKQLYLFNVRRRFR
jgi:hypothetical protein